MSKRILAYPINLIGGMKFPVKLIGYVDIRLLIFERGFFSQRSVETNWG